MQIKDFSLVFSFNLFALPPLFELIQKESGTGWKDMYQVFNMGHRMEIYLPEEIAQDAIAIAQSFGIDAQVIGRVEEAEQNEVVIDGAFGTFSYQ